LKKISLIAAAGFVLLLAIMVSIGAAGNVEIRGNITNFGVVQFTWDNATFPGFYYDINKKLGAEQLTFRLSNVDLARSNATLSDQPDEFGNRGVVYTTHAQLKTFKYKPWGQYDVIGFLANRYFASYDPTVTASVINAGESAAFLYNRSKNRNLMANEQISKVLIDDNNEMTITPATPLQFDEGYQLIIKSIDEKEQNVSVELMKNGQVVDSKVIHPSIDNAKMADKTYYYAKDIGDAKGIVIIAVHFKTVFHGQDTSMAAIDGIFQLSDASVSIKADQQYNKMSIKNVNATKMVITMDNKGNMITLSKNKDVVLMQNLHIKTADQEVIDANHPLRYYIYNMFTEPGTYELRGTLANVLMNNVTWDNSSFPGFYYDIDKNLGAESITFRPSLNSPTIAMLSDQMDPYTGMRGVVYTTHAQLKTFEYKPWGQYDVIGFLGDKYFAAYDPTVTADVANINMPVAFLYDQSKYRNLMNNEQISKVLIDDNKERTITSDTSLKLEEGYELSIKAINTKGDKAYLELTKKGQVVDSSIIRPSIEHATMADKTYFYKTYIGGTADIIQIAVHFRNIFHSDNNDSAIIDGIFQISDTPITLTSDQQYGKMSIRAVDPSMMAITMDNKDNQIILSRNMETLLMQNIYIKTADQDGTFASPLRYYIYADTTSS
jgi:S-layer protein (TIGR01567 family)